MQFMKESRFLGDISIFSMPKTDKTFHELDNDEIIIRTKRFFFSYAPTPFLRKFSTGMYRFLTAKGEKKHGE